MPAQLTHCYYSQLECSGHLCASKIARSPRLVFGRKQFFGLGQVQVNGIRRGTRLEVPAKRPSFAEETPTWLELQTFFNLSALLSTFRDPNSTEAYEPVSLQQPARAI